VVRKQMAALVVLTEWMRASQSATAPAAAILARVYADGAAGWWVAPIIPERTRAITSSRSVQHPAFDFFGTGASPTRLLGATVSRSS